MACALGINYKEEPLNRREDIIMIRLSIRHLSGICTNWKKVKLRFLQQALFSVNKHLSLRRFLSFNVCAPVVVPAWPVGLQGDFH